MVRPVWKRCKAEKFWRNRRSNIIRVISNLSEKIRSMRSNAQERKRRKSRRKMQFKDQNLFTIRNDVVSKVEKVSRHLEFWSRFLSWNYCRTCKGLVAQKLLPNFVKRNKLVAPKCMLCKAKRYPVPLIKNVPVQLKGLTMKEIVCLRPFQIYSGRFLKVQHGYRVRNEPFKVFWSGQTVEEKISAIADENSQRRVRVAFNYLMEKQDSSYKKFIQMHECYTRQPFLFEQFTHDTFKGIECALWPHLYHKTILCESVIEGNNSRLSSKVSYMTKVKSQVIDYGIEYDLLHYQYDRWLFKTITGAINTCKRTGCSPARSLECKDFSELYWRNQHRFLIDCVRQNGFPSIFITISPYEWSFPFGAWLDDVREKTGSCPTDVAVLETLHISHVLEQMIRGFICGKNSNRWKTHVFKSKSNAACNNVVQYFYRFEFQKRGTLHAHLLIWLGDLKEVDLNTISGSVPRTSAEEAFEIYDLQKSNCGCLQLHLGESAVIEENDALKIVLHHDEIDKRANISAYSPPLSAALKCSMDLQTTDGKGMLLKYVSSYVTKNQDVVHQQELFSKHTTAYQAAHSFLRNAEPLEPEMAIQLSNVKTAWNNARTKSVFGQILSQEVTGLYKRYLQRKPDQQNMCYLEWLRKYNTARTTPTPYKSGSTLVGVKYLSVFKAEYFFQLMAMHVKHRRPQEMLHRRHDDLPEAVRFYLPAVERLPNILSSPEKFVEYLTCEAHKKHHLENVASYVRSLDDIVTLWKIHVINKEFAAEVHGFPSDEYHLSPQQEAVCVNFLCLARASREDHFSSRENALNSTNASTSHDYTTYQMLLGPPGTGKSQIIKKLISILIEEDINVAFSAPLGILVSTYRDIFENQVLCDTVHALFQIPVEPTDNFSINYSLHHYDVIIIDEASMITVESFSYIDRTVQSLPHRPLVVLTGDEQQQPPLQTVHGRTQQAPSILHDRSLRAISEVTRLHQQFRTTDRAYHDFLNYIRYSRPDANVLDKFQRDLVLFNKENIDDEDIWNTILRMPDAKFLTISRAAASRVNKIVLERGFPESSPLSDISLEQGEEVYPPLNGMKVVITRNLNKTTGLVNGRSCKIVGAENRTLIISFVNGTKNFVYPMTTTDDDGNRVVKYPLAPSYAETVCKTQGATISKLILWLDCPNVPSGMGYVALSRVRNSDSIRFLRKAVPDQFLPVIQ